MYAKSLSIQNFKAFKNVTIHFNRDLNVLTGVNNSGKTTVLEALSLWQECFSKLISEARRAEKTYKRGDYILGPSYNKYFPFNEINSVRSPNFEDIFHNRNTKNEIIISLTIEDQEGYKQTIPFHIKSSGSNYVISLHGYSSFNHRAFNDFFSELPNPVALVYGTPVAQIDQEEQFTTDPSIKDKLLIRQSVSVFRNRLYRILNGIDGQLTNSFLNDLNFVLFNNEKVIEFRTVTNIQRDPKVIILFKIGAKDIEKDIALLGSGSLQIIEILLNLYSPTDGKKDLTLVLLDEPDSHIHRDIQKRLIETFNKFGKNIQMFITTHNESLIRDSAPSQVFHLDAKPEGEIKSIHYDTESHLGLHFKGIFPNVNNTVIRSIGSTNGLDFINALEADRLIFVEGEDDARVFRILLNQQLNNRKKYMFWVLGGVGEIFENILSYKTVFSAIKNQKTLWEKSVLCFDKDELSNEHKDVLLQKFKDKLGIDAYSSNAYTFESTLMTDLEKTAKLICRLIEKANGNQADLSDVQDGLIYNYRDYKSFLEAKLTNKYFEDAYYRYKNSKNEKTKKVFDENDCIFKPKGEAQLMTYIRDYFSSAITSGEYYKLMDKKDVENVILPIVEPYGINFSIETDFIELIKLVDKSTWISEWDFLTQI